MAIEREGDARAFLTQRRGGPLTFGALLRAIRRGERATLATFAARLGETKQHLSDIEHGRRGVSVERAAAWAKALGYHPGQFVELAIQAQLHAARLPFSRVSLSRAAPAWGAAVAVGRGGTHSGVVVMIRDKDDRHAEWRRDEIAALRRRIQTVPIGERLLEAIALSAVLLADSLNREGGEVRERPLPPGLGPLRS